MANQNQKIETTPLLFVNEIFLIHLPDMFGKKKQKEIKKKI
jgi:hypothetical protein